VIVNQAVPVTLLVEERAQYTILSERLAQQLGMQITPRTSEVRFEFAGRTYTAPVVNLPSLKIGELEVRNIPILIWNLSSYSEIDGVLGMSFLKHFQVEIKHDEQLLILTK
jgi:clan AA aspartic protease (TIGR02281 family)